MKHYITEMINAQLDKLIVFGNKLTAHHKNSIKVNLIKPTCINFLEWVHINGYIFNAHMSYKPRTWSQYSDPKIQYTCEQLYLIYQDEKKL